MTLGEIVNKIMGEIPRMSQPKAIDVAKDAWDEIVGEKGWTWNTKQGVINIPGTVSTGTVGVTRGSQAIDFDGDAVTALNASDDLVPIIGRQVRFAGQNILYTIVTYDTGTGVGTIDRAYTGETDAAISTWSVFKSYHTPPGGIDFAKFNSIIDPDNGYRIRFAITKDSLDKIDPQRQAEGNPYRVALVDRNDPTLPGVPRFEFWPLPGTEVSLQVQYQSKGLVDYNGVSFPNLAYVFPRELPSRLIREKCMEMAYRWAEAHKGMHEELQGSNWRFLWQKAEAVYVKLLMEARKNDDEIDITEYIDPYVGYEYPVDSNFAQSHIVDWMY